MKIIGLSCEKAYDRMYLVEMNRNEIARIQAEGICRNDLPIGYGFDVDKSWYLLQNLQSLTKQLESGAKTLEGLAAIMTALKAIGDAAAAPAKEETISEGK